MFELALAFMLGLEASSTTIGLCIYALHGAILFIAYLRTLRELCYLSLAVSAMILCINGFFIPLLGTAEPLKGIGSQIAFNIGIIAAPLVLAALLLLILHEPYTEI